MRLLFFCFFLFCALPAGAVPTGIPYELGGKNCFADEPGLKPLYFCQCVDTPVQLPPEHGDQLLLQLIQSVAGISRNEKTGEMVMKKLAIFQAIKKDGHMELRNTERVIGLGKHPAGTMKVTSNEPALGAEGTRTTVLHLDPNSDKATIRIQLWKGADRQQKPSFDHTYHFRYKKV